MTYLIQRSEQVHGQDYEVGRLKHLQAIELLLAGCRWRGNDQ